MPVVRIQPKEALLELKYQNYIYAVPKSGYYVLEGRNKVDNKINLTLTVQSIGLPGISSFV